MSKRQVKKNIVVTSHDKFTTSHTKFQIKPSIAMPVLSALDLIESRGLPRSILLLSTIEAETLDLEQNNRSSRDIHAAGKNAPSRRHARSSSSLSVGKTLCRSPDNTPRAWAIAISTMGELRRMAPYHTGTPTRLPVKLPGHPPISKVPMLSALDLIEIRGPLRRNSLISKIEAETRDHFELLENDNESSQDMDATRREAQSKRHARTWNGTSSRIGRRRHALRTSSCVCTGFISAALLFKASWRAAALCANAQY